MNGTILDVESSSVRLILISVVPFCFSIFNAMFHPVVRKKCCLLLSRTQWKLWVNFLPRRRETPFFCRQNSWHFWLANHRTSCRTSGVIQPKSEKLRYRTDNYYWVRPKANGERSIVTMGYSYYTMLHFISLWSVIWSVLVILIKTMGKVHSSNTVKLNVRCFFTETVNTRQLFYKKKLRYLGF